MKTRRDERLHPSLIPWAVVGGEGAEAVEPSRDRHVSRDNLPLWKAKLLYMFAYATVGAFAPYLSTFLIESLELSSSALGFIGALTPMMTSMCTPIWGALADRTGRHTRVMISNHVISVSFRLLLLWVSLCFPGRKWAKWGSAGIVAAAACFMSSVYSILDDLCFRAIRRRVGTGSTSSSSTGTWARLRMFGSIGFGMGAFISGQLADVSRFHYGVAFLVSVLCAVPTALLMLTCFDGVHGVEDRISKSRASKPLKACLEACWLQQGILVRSLWFGVLLSGANFSILEVFLFPLLRQRAISSSTLGFIRAINGISSVPFFFWAGSFVSTLGVVGTFSLAAAANAVRFLFHSFYATQSLSTVGAVELLYGVTGGAFWAAATAFAQSFAPPGSGSTMMGILTSLHYGVGSVIGSTLGGMLSSHFGDLAKMFAFMGMLNAFVSVALGTVVCLNKAKAPKDDTSRASKILFGISRHRSMLEVKDL